MFLLSPARPGHGASIGLPLSSVGNCRLPNDWKSSRAPKPRERPRVVGCCAARRATRATQTDRKSRLWAPDRRCCLDRKRPALRSFRSARRQLGEPFDFLTWFEYAPEHVNAFEELVRRLRSTPEWHYVEREVDVRLSR